jgi:glycogen operon protein
MNDNFSWNCGHEGETDNPEIEALRSKQIKNMFTMMMVSQGTPMLLMGDEVRRTQNGNNNAYCQNNEISWFDWELLEKNAGLYRFVKMLINDFFKKFKILHEERFWIDDNQGKNPHVTWHGIKVGQPDWGKNSHSVAYTLGKSNSKEHLHVMINAYWDKLSFELPVLSKNPKGKWVKIVDTAEESPYDIKTIKEGTPIKGNLVELNDRSIMILYTSEK